MILQVLLYSVKRSSSGLFVISFLLSVSFVRHADD